MTQNARISKPLGAAVALALLASVSGCDLFTPKVVTADEACFALLRGVAGAFRAGGMSSFTATASAGGKTIVSEGSAYGLEEYTFYTGSLDFEDQKIGAEQTAFYDTIDNLTYRLSGSMQLECDYRVKDFGDGKYPFYCFSVESGNVTVTDEKGAERVVSVAGLYFSVELDTEGDGSYSASMFLLSQFDGETLDGSYCFYLDKAGWRTE